VLNCNKHVFVNIDLQVAVVGCPSANGGIGAAYVYDRAPNNTWALRHSLVPPYQDDSYGYAAC
jgi:tripartite-type tricarboxylate transporter receptor subunit TctC